MKTLKSWSLNTQPSKRLVSTKYTLTRSELSGSSSSPNLQRCCELRQIPARLARASDSAADCAELAGTESVQSKSLRKRGNKAYRATLATSTPKTTSKTLRARTLLLLHGLSAVGCL